jgi:peptidoglycan/xylan/chitin deacetylase (PgdA/CDA1 family)
MLKDALVRLGVAAALRPVLGGLGSVLVFHRVRPRDPGLMFEANHRNSIPAETLHTVLDTLAADGVEVVSLDEALSRLEAPRPARFACLTFDDGYRDNHDTLLPILTARAVPATIYIAPGLVDGTAPLWWYMLDEVIAREPRIALPLPQEITIDCADRAAKERAFAQAAGFMLGAAPDAAARLTQALAARYGADPAGFAARHMMSWEMVRALAASPLIEIGAHTMTHPPLAALDAAAAAAEMQGSRARLERETGRLVRHLAYPYGTPATTGAREMAIAAELGFRTAVTTLPGSLSRRHAAARQAWPRHGIGPADGAAAVRLKLAGLSNPIARLRARGGR